MTKEKYLRQEYIIFKSINYSILFVNSLQVSCIPIKISPIELVFSFFLFFFFLSNIFDISTLYYANKM